MFKQFKNLDRVKGSLLGGALGDALGSPVKEMSLDEIAVKYGYQGINGFDLAHYSKAPISDYTYLVYYTSKGILLNQYKKEYLHIDEPLYLTIYDYLREYLEKSGVSIKKDELSTDMLNHLEGMNNDCSSVIRIAPLGLAYQYIDDPVLEAAMLTFLTNNHPYSFLSSILMMFIIREIVKDDGRTLWRIIKDSIREFNKFYAKLPRKGLEDFYKRNKEYKPKFIDLMNKSLLFVKHDIDDKYLVFNYKKIHERIASIGIGKTSEEALAIAIYCAIKYQTNPEQGVKIAVNIDGDSAAVGVLTGQILGAYYGQTVIPLNIIDKVDFGKTLDDLATGLVNGIKEDNQDWIKEHL